MFRKLSSFCHLVKTQLLWYVAVSKGTKSAFPFQMKDNLESNRKVNNF